MLAKSKIRIGNVTLSTMTFSGTYLKLSFCGELKRETTKRQSKDLLVTVVHSGMRGPERLVNLLNGWRNL